MGFKARVDPECSNSEIVPGRKDHFTNARHTLIISQAETVPRLKTTRDLSNPLGTSKLVTRVTRVTIANTKYLGV